MNVWFVCARRSFTITKDLRRGLHLENCVRGELAEARLARNVLP